MIEVQIHNPHGASRMVMPKGIVIHSMGEFLEGNREDSYAPYFLKDYGLSAHRFITPTGIVVECRGDQEGAYHAKGYNTTHLGIEFMVPGVHTYETFKEKIKEVGWLTEAQFEAGVELVVNWCKKFRIPVDKIVRHSDISPGRKFDPGSGFPWELFMQRVGNQLRNQ